MKVPATLPGLGFALALLSSALPVVAEVTLVQDRANPLAIYHPAAPRPQERTAALELAMYLEKLSGAKFAVLPTPSPLPEAGIFVGVFDSATTNGLGPDAFRIRARARRVELVGGNPQATLYAVFALLEEHLGCRWWSHDEETIPPAKPTLTLPDLDTVTRPAFALHNVWNREAQSAANHFMFKARTTSAEGFSGGHTMYPLLTPYATAHPEIYPLSKTGERKGNHLHFCYLARGIAEALADALEKQIITTKRDESQTIFFAGMGDWYGGMCECADCQKVYAEETWTDPDGRKKPGYTATLLRMINRTAELLEAKHPGVRIGTFAYMSLEAPPAKTRPRDNVVIRVPRLRHCTVHPARTCKKNASFRRNLERWCQLAPGRIYVWEYGANFKNYLHPFPCLFSLADNLKFYQSLGIRGVEIQGNYGSLGGDLAVLKNYVWRRLFWQPALDPQALVREFCAGYYEPASTEMLAYVDTLEKSIHEPQPTCADEFAGPQFLTAPIRARLTTHRDEALAKVSSEPALTQRIREATVGLDTLELWAPGPFAERDGRLVRADLGQDTYDRAQEVLKNIRHASPNEWSSGRAAHMDFVAWHGGPLVTLTNAELTVTLAPLLNGQIRQLTFRGRPLLHIENNPKTKGFPFVGGSVDAVGTRHMLLDGEPTARSALVIGEAGVAMFGGATKQLVHRTFTLDDSGTLSVTNTVRLPRPGAAAEKRDATVTTVYAIGAGPESARVEIQTMSGETWRPVDMPPGKTDFDLPARVTALRVHLPAQNCAVADHYSGVAIASGRIVRNTGNATLTTVLTTEPVAVPDTGERVFLQRRLHISSTPSAPR